jgi:hypothetical protein
MSEEILGMNDRTGRQRDATSEILFPLLFDIDGYLKGYVGGLVVFSTGKLAYRLSRGDPMMRVSASLFGVLFRQLRQAEMIAWLMLGDRCARFDVKDRPQGLST